MRQLSPDGALQLAAAKWLLSGGRNGDELGEKALALRDAPAAKDWPGAAALPAAKTFAEAALGVSTMAYTRFLAEQLRLYAQNARLECNAWRAAEAVRQAQAEAKRFGALEGAAVTVVADGETAGSASDPYKERADL